MLKTRLKSYSFWVSFASAVILILKLIGQKYGFTIDAGFLSDLVTAVCGLLVILGIFVVPKNNSSENTQSENNLENNIQDNDSNLTTSSNTSLNPSTNLFNKLFDTSALLKNEIQELTNNKNQDISDLSNKEPENSNITSQNKQLPLPLSELDNNESISQNNNETTANTTLKINNCTNNIANLYDSKQSEPLEQNDTKNEVSTEYSQILDAPIEENRSEVFNQQQDHNEIKPLEFTEKITSLISDELNTSTKNSADIKILLKKIIDNLGE